MSTILNNSSYLKKQPSYMEQSQTLERNQFAIRDLEKTIHPRNFLNNKHQCCCDLCLREKIIDEKPNDSNMFESKSKASTHWLKKILDSLCLSGAKTLKLYLPDLFFVDGQSFETFQTSPRDGRLLKLSGTTPFKFLYPTLIRYRKEYKYSLQLNFNQKMLESIDPQFMHLSYFDKFVPSSFHDGMRNIQILQENKHQFRRYILHKNKKYEIQQIEEHKMNDKEPFVIVKYTDGNCQLFNQIQFQVYMLSSPQKLQEEISFVQSYIKYKLETQAIYYSQYTLDAESVGSQVDRRAQNEVMVLIGGLHKYQEGYIDVDSIEQITQELMLKNPKAYVQLQTYKIVHYLNMTSRMYIDHLKLKWIMNDLGNIYLQQIMEFQMSEVARRLIKYRLPPKDEVLDGVSNTNNFGKLYLQMKKRKYVNTVRIKQMVQEKSPEQILSMMEGEQFQGKKTKKSIDKDKGKKINEVNAVRTILTSQTQRRNQIGRYKGNRENQLQKNKERYSSIDAQHCNKEWSSFGRGKLSLKMNRFFTVTPKDQKGSRSQVKSCRTHRILKFDPTLAPQPSIISDNKRCGSTLSTFKDIKKGV